MGPDGGVQRIVRTATGSAGNHVFAAALWVRGKKFFAEARVFVRGPLPEVRGALATVRVEADYAELAITLLESKLAEKFGRVCWVQWAKPEA